jgi:Leucine-rich repeat (LRR) protein
MAVTTAHDFLQLVEKSRLLSPEQLALVRTWPEHEPKMLADRLVSEGWITAWQSEMLVAGKHQFFLGKYKLLDLLGIGGMGRVFKAVVAQPAIGRVVALKVMSKAVLKQPKALQRFLREIQSAAAIDHPNIVHAYDANHEGDNYFLVMEFVSGQNLKWWIQKEKILPIGWSCECIRQAALGLQHAFEQGMVHRDIKPSNLLVTQNEPDGLPLVKILDFGLARFASETRDDGELTRSGQVLGTPDYIAPEQASNTRTADIRADIFSLGCTFFEMLTGRLPFPGETVMEKLMARATQDAPALRSFRPEATPELEAIVARMLARNPLARYATPAEVAQALAAFALVAAGMAAARGASPDPAAAPAAETFPNAGFPTFDFLEEETRNGFPAGAARTRGEGGRDVSSFPALWRQPRIWTGAGIIAALLAFLAILSLRPGTKPPESSERGTEHRPKKKRAPVTVDGQKRPADLENDPGSTTALDLHGRTLDAGDLARLAEMARLKILNLAGTDISDETLENVRGLTSLERLDLSDTRISDKGIARLKGLARLQTLQLARTRITGAALESLTADHNLTELSLAETQISDPDLRHLSALSQLQTLNLDRTRVRGGGLRFLRPLKELSSLDLSGLPMQGLAFSHLSALENLRFLRLTRARVKDDDLRHLSGLTRLRELLLGSTSITGPGLERLAWMADLERLDLDGTVAGDSGLKFLSGLSSLRSLNLHGTAISDAGLEALRSLNRLESLDVGETRVTSKSVEALKKALPNCKVEF